MLRDTREAVLERAVSDAQREIDEAKAKHRAALNDLRRYRKERAKANEQLRATDAQSVP